MLSNRMYRCLLLTTMIMVSYAHAENAGLTALVRQSALNTIVRQYMPNIESKISSIALPDYENRER